MQGSPSEQGAEGERRRGAGEDTIEGEGRGNEIEREGRIKVGGMDGGKGVEGGGRQTGEIYGEMKIEEDREWEGKNRNVQRERG